MKSIWNPELIVAGLSVPVQMFSSVESSKPSAVLIDSRDKARIRYQKINEISGAVVPGEFIVKAFEKDGVLYPVPQNELDDLKPIPSKQIVFGQFIENFDLDPRRVETFYWLMPQKEWEINYSLLLKALSNSFKYGLGEAVYLNNQVLFCLGVFNYWLLLYKLRFNEQIVLMNEKPQACPLSPDNTTISDQLYGYITSNTISLDSHVFSSDFNKNLMAKLITQNS
jgi:DNA end-binding protein Ku